MDWLFAAFGVLFSVIYIFLQIVRTLRRKQEIVFTDILFAFFTALVLLTGLIFSGLDGATDGRVELAVLVTAGVLAVFGVILTIRELFRPQRLRQSRGLLTLGIGVLLALSSVVVPFAGAYFSLPPRSDDRVLVAASQPTPDPGAEFFAVFNQVIQIIAQASNLTQDEVLTALDKGETVANLVERNKGDLERVIDDITVVMQDFLRQLSSQRRVDPLRASAGIAGMELVVRYAVNNDLSSLQRAGEEEAGATPLPTQGEGTPRPSFFGFLTASFTPDETNSQLATSLPPTNTLFPTITPPPTNDSTATRTPQPTLTPTSTREPFSTRTPTLTPTLPSPCLASMKFNVNMRAEPDTNAPLIITIPYETVVNVFGRNEESSWWYVEYEGNAGWVSNEFVTVTSSCSKLPVRD